MLQDTGATRPYEAASRIRGRRAMERLEIANQCRLSKFERTNVIGSRFAQLQSGKGVLRLAPLENEDLMSTVERELEEGLLHDLIVIRRGKGKSPTFVPVGHHR